VRGGHSLALLDVVDIARVQYAVLDLGSVRSLPVQRSNQSSLLFVVTKARCDT
jgi:hypothetical protein